MKLVLVPVLACLVISLGTPASAQKNKKKAALDAPPSREALLKEVRPVDGFRATIFAAPPDVSYPTCLCTSPGGDVFVGVDLNGSLGTKKGQGRVIRCIDSDRDGVAERFDIFCEVDHPRGLFFDRGKLIVLHPPFLSAFYDDDGDGKADRSEVLVKNISTDLTSKRGGDHTTNGFRLGIDGWLYVAVGDFGFLGAEGKDGKKVQLYGGGVVRVRPDGTELEIVSRGQRNIYDVAVSPLLELFTRDNTNDGGGWDVRLSHVVPLGHYGYPSLFKNFTDEALAPLADYGGGSPTGALYLAEPGFPEGFGDTLYTVEWGRQAIFRHQPKRLGASYDKTEQKPFVQLPAPTDLDVDGSGQLYLTSWRGGGFNFSHPFVGFVARVVPKDWKYEPFPDLAAASDTDVLGHLASPSAFRRQYAQLELLRRGPRPVVVKGLEESLMSGQPLAVRVAALFTLKQLLKAEALPAIVASARVPELREYSIRAAVDRVGEAAGVKSEWLTSFLTDADPRVRLQALIALGRLGRKEAAAAMVPLTDDPDPVLRHIAVQALQRLRPVEACLAALDQGRSVAGSLRVLQSIHEPAVADALLARYGKAATAEEQQALLPGLCRLYYEEAPWDGKWWGTRPDTTGPYFKRVTWSASERIGAALKQALTEVDSPTLRLLLVELRKHRIDLPEANAPLLKLARTDPTFRPQAIELYAAASSIPDEALDLFRQAALDSGDKSGLRVKALRGLHRFIGQKGFFDAAVEAFARLGPRDAKQKELASAWEDFTRDVKQGQHVGDFVQMADDKDAARRDLALTVLVNLASGKLTPSDVRQVAERRVERAWTQEAMLPPLLEALARTRTDAYAYQVRGLLKDGRPQIRQAAEATWKTLGLDQQGSGKREVLRGRPYEEVFLAAQKLPGDAKVGASIFLKQGCIACHTVSPSEPMKGPYLGDIAARYKRPDMIESILKPSAKISQGFETIFFELASGKVVEGFIVRESGDEVELRTNAGIVQVLQKKDIEDRGRRNVSVMPEGLTDDLTIGELASLLAYLESLNTKK